MPFLNLSKREMRILWAVIEIKARDAEDDDDDERMLELGLLEELPSAGELRAIADVIAELRTGHGPYKPD